MHWTKTTPNRIEIKINSHADRHVLAFLQLQAVVLALRADCAAGLLIFTNKKPDAAGTGIGEARKKNMHAKSQRAHARDYRHNKVSGNSPNHPAELAHYQR